MAENNEKISDIIATSLEKVKTLADAQTIIGDPISANGGTTIIPVSKVSVGIASGGSDCPAKDAKDPSKSFKGAGGTGITVSPVAFLVISSTGSVELLTLNAGRDSIDKVASLVDKTPDFIERIKTVLTKKDNGNKNTPAETEKTGRDDGEAEKE